ncbi:cell surface protein [Lactobacillus sp. CBA3606]|uniref:WxL domain-containing protein n=1 Tax=Lactobacillus sp. CBA3606 TaxID=2099789 RepID=UPI000CFC3226|nr:WxL domain-containing protein [Lactobacillus sp. CBA3606]AVK63994.1 cell surface protein [Lactobacillus sp. CBA3606]
MKKYIGTLLAGISLMTVLPLAAQAADTTTSKDTTAEIELTQDETKKDITLDSAPDIDLGTNTNNLATQTYTANAVTGLAQVTNPGNTDGWHVDVKGTSFTTSDSKSTLRGAALSLNSGQVEAEDSSNASTAPTAQNVTVNSENQSILSADAGEGIGVFTMTHDKDNVSLNVPAGNAAGAYKSTLTWTLTNAPS